MYQNERNQNQLTKKKSLSLGGTKTQPEMNHTQGNETFNRHTFTVFFYRCNTLLRWDDLEHNHSNPHSLPGLLLKNRLQRLR